VSQAELLVLSEEEGTAWAEMFKEAAAGGLQRPLSCRLSIPSVRPLLMLESHVTLSPPVAGNKS